MGREIKRVALDFNWPLNIVWKGYQSPYAPTNCKACDGSGYSPEAKEIVDTWYSFEDRSKAWYTNITQDEVQALVDNNRLFDFTHDWTKENGWTPKPGNPMPTAAEVNAWAKQGFGHDAINRAICIEARCKRLGIVDHCKLCEGKGYYWCDDKYEELSEVWERIEPPAGPGYQLWETVSEGSPMSPVFAEPEDLAAWLVDTKYNMDRKHDIHKDVSYDAWLKFIQKEESCMSLIMENGQWKDAVEDRVAHD